MQWPLNLSILSNSHNGHVALHPYVNHLNFFFVVLPTFDSNVLELDLEIRFVAGTFFCVASATMVM